MSEISLVRTYDRLLGETKSRFPAFTSRLLVDDPKNYPHKRNSARCMYRDTAAGRQIDILVAPKVLRMDAGRQEGLLMHEFGHAVQFHVGEEGLAETVGSGLPADIEEQADTIGERLYGAPIYYDHDLIQTTVGGERPRPQKLRNGTMGKKKKEMGKKKKEMGWGPVIVTTAIAAVDVVSTPVTLPLGPLAMTEFLTVPLAFFVWTKKLDSYEGKGEVLRTRENPPPLLLGLLAAPLLIGGLGIGGAALAWSKYKSEKDRLANIQSLVEDHPVLSLLNPWVMSASAAAVAHARRVSPWKAAIVGWAVGKAAHTAARYVLLAKYAEAEYLGDDA